MNLELIIQNPSSALYIAWFGAIIFSLLVEKPNGKYSLLEELTVGTMIGDFQDSFISLNWCGLMYFMSSLSVVLDRQEILLLIQFFSDGRNRQK
jgi:hypothetical protein